MRIFKNSDGSFDIVNTNRVLFHAKNGQLKLIGRVSPSWRTASKQVSRLPVKLKPFKCTIELTIYEALPRV
jgi:hypothetical protein